MKDLISGAMLMFTLAAVTVVAREPKPDTPTEITAVEMQQDFQEISASDLPDAVTAAIANDYPNATVNKAYTDGQGLYKIDITLEDGSSQTVYADEEGNWKG